jgi:hypothetical protein
MQWPDVGRNGGCSFFVHFCAFFLKAPKNLHKISVDSGYLSFCGSFARSCAPEWRIAGSMLSGRTKPDFASTYAIDAASGLSRAGSMADTALCNPYEFDREGTPPWL